MPTIIPVKFTYAARDLWFDPAGTGAQEADHVICSTERGTEIGLATGDAREVSEEELEHVIGHAQLRSVVRIATDSDLDRAEQLAARGEDAMPTFRRLVGASGLDMKPVGVEYLFDGEKAVCYFAAEERVDFRQLVRDLSRELHVRIDMRQIGVREEAAIVGGYGHCGQELCCRRFNMSFDPVSIRMAKEQDLPLNSTKISGACGRLMCCLRYEFEAYRDFKGRAPKRNAVIDTPLGKGKIIEYDTPKEQICLRLESGKQIRVALADMTASEAACKKSKELGCACRPDTVTREVLDRLDSPDVQMALAELDRKNGVAPEQTVDAADIFVSTRRKRRRSDEGGNASGSASGARGSQSGEKGNRPQHMRGGAQGQAAGEAAGEDGRRRRKRRGGADAANGSAPAAGQQARPGRGQQPAASDGKPARRRHHQAGEATPERGGEQQPKRGGGMRPKRTRRPGDKGGNAGSGTQQGNAGGQRPASGEGTGDAPKPRRRHRGGRGRGPPPPPPPERGPPRRGAAERIFSPGGFCRRRRGRCGLEPAPCHNF